jgi:hypothetical protein
MGKIKFLIFISVIFLCSKNLYAQNRGIDRNKQKLSYTDSLYLEMDNTIYNSFYDSSYFSTLTPTFTILKIDINKRGKVTGIQFSDSADTVFVKTYLNRKKWHDDKATIEKYAKVKSYKGISLLIPVSWEPNYPNQKKIFSYDEMEGIMKFNGKDFTGQSVLLQPIYIRISPNGNM